MPFEILIILLPVDEFYRGSPTQPGDGPGGDPGDEPGSDPGGEPGDGPGDDPRLPGGDPRFPSGSSDEGVCCMPDGACDTTTADDCAQRGGAFVVGETCGTYVCPRTGGSVCAEVEGEITDICYTYENGVLKVFASYAITNKGPVAANDITAYALVGLNDGVNGLGGGSDSQDWRYGIDIPAGGTYAYDLVFTATAPSLDLSKLSYLYGSLWLQVEAPWDCWPITRQTFVQTWDPAPRCAPSGDGNQGTPPSESADLVITMNLVDPSSEPVADDSRPQYNLTVWNNGPDTARNVILKLAMPSEVTTLDAGLSPVYTAQRPPNDVIEWHIGDKPVPAGKGVWLQAGIDAGFCGSLIYQFEVSSDTPDPDMSNNAGTLTTQVGPCDGRTPSDPPPDGSDEGAGACCLPDGSCQRLDEATCVQRDGLFYGPGVACSEIRCFPAEDPPCPIIQTRVTDACQLYQGPDQPMIVKADFSLSNPGGKDAFNVHVKFVAGVPLLANLVTTYNDEHSFTIPIIPAGGSQQISHTFSISPAPPQQPTGQTVVMVFAAPDSSVCKPSIGSMMDFFHLLYFGPDERICPDDGGAPPGGEGETPGACCLPDGSCETLVASECDRQGGQPFDPGTSCIDTACDGAPPGDGDDGTTDDPTEPEPDPGTGALPNLWVTDVAGCWSWSTDGQEHVIARVSGTIHNGGQATASNVKARLGAGGQTQTVTVGTIPAGGQKTVSATMDIGAYDTVSWPVSINVTADHTHSITEADETNNSTNSSFPQN
ncbi:hypothetical protein KJ567_00385, partial [Candidatus Bipolaricaulota bacterium]|nr:hypothetical protein [Candidatus Bipolaricaulota bacterium]